MANIPKYLFFRLRRQPRTKGRCTFVPAWAQRCCVQLLLSFPMQKAAPRRRTICKTCGRKGHTSEECMSDRTISDDERKKRFEKFKAAKIRAGTWKEHPSGNAAQHDEYEAFVADGSPTSVAGFVPADLGANNTYMFLYSFYMTYM